MNIQDLLSISIGKTVTSCKIGGETNSILAIKFEDATSYTILCCWRIEHCGIAIKTIWSVIDSSIDLKDESVEEIIGNRLLSYKLSDHYDLKLYFENEFVVSVFCNVLGRCAEDDAIFYSNWCFSVPDLNIDVNIIGHFSLVYTNSNDDTIILP